MFRIGGSTNDGIVSMAVPRGKYANSNYEQLMSQYPQAKELLSDAESKAAFMSAFAGSGRSRDDRLSDLLISGGLNLMSARPTGGILSTAASAFKEPTSQYLKGSEAEDSFQRQLRLAGLTSAMTSQENKEKYKKELEIAGLKLEQGEKELFLKTSGLGTNAGSIYDTKRALEKKGEKVVGAVSTVGSGDQVKPTPSSVLSIPEGSVFYDVNGNFYRRVPKDESNKLGWKRIQLSGEDIKAGAPVKPTGFFERAKESGAAYDPRSWNKQKFYEQLLRNK
jgi:hypothetical protein